MSNYGPYSGRRDETASDGTRFEIMEHHNWGERYWVVNGQEYTYGMLTGFDARVSNPGEWISCSGNWDMSYSGIHHEYDTWYIATGDMSPSNPWAVNVTFIPKINIYYMLDNGSIILHQEKDIGTTLDIPTWNNIDGYTFKGWKCNNTYYAPSGTVGPEDWNVKTQSYAAGQYTGSNNVYLTPAYQKNAWSE